MPTVSSFAVRHALATVSRCIFARGLSWHASVHAQRRLLQLKPCASVGTQPQAVRRKHSRVSEVPACYVCSARGAAARDWARGGGAARRRRGARRPHDIQPTRAGGRPSAGRAGHAAQATQACRATRWPCCAVPPARQCCIYVSMAESLALPRRGPRRGQLNKRAVRRPGRDRLRAELQLDDRRGQGRGPVRAGALVHQRARLLRAPGAPGAGPAPAAGRSAGRAWHADAQLFFHQQRLFAKCGPLRMLWVGTGCRPRLAGRPYSKVNVLKPMCWRSAAHATCAAPCAQHATHAATVRLCCVRPV